MLSVKDTSACESTHLPQSLANINKQVNQFTETLRQVFARFDTQCNTLRPFFIHVHETIRQLPNDIQEIVSALADRGWYISGEMDIVFLRSLHRAVQDENWSLGKVKGVRVGITFH